MEEVCWRYEAALEHCKARMVESADTADLKSYKFMDILAINIR
jgi:hypothetical protein